MKTLCLIVSLCCAVLTTYAQDSSLVRERINRASTVKDQQSTGTCWCFGPTSMVESENIRKGYSVPDISEMYTVRNIYLEKAKNYVLRQGKAQFDEGGLGHDAINAMGRYGMVPAKLYTGLVPGRTFLSHGRMQGYLKNYLDSILKLRPPIPTNWIDGFTTILNTYMGEPPASFEYNGKTYTPLTFAKEVMKFNADDYVYLTSFSHHPFYKSFIIEVPDNYSNGSYYNLPLQDLLDIAKTTINKGYTISWDADVSNRGWNPGNGFAMEPVVDTALFAKTIDQDMPEKVITQESRQRLFEDLVTQDDHLMHITGIGYSPKGRIFFIVKNSWGLYGPFHGYQNVSEAYFANNTISIVVPKAALDKKWKALLK
ncbi:C1 family peptidase [Chitinophaga sp. Cy-1792]|uniref:C1 family peptidase n=1 Tax=Chitinophaga sp. Cy-1792 TaxID=2608339 RepID=UPI0014219245|nr:C1 family peptidase [Chitinophaga sp. Cy-1792]NIG57722.1 aminopeptidase [Chitinophaga sp. Cy-1792]